MRRDVLASAFLFSVIVVVSAFAIDDDEIHDREILRAVVSSVREWQQRKDSHRVKRDEEIVCYGELGCFRDEGPFDYLDTLPSPPEEIDTKFFVATRKSDEIFSYFNYTLIGPPVFNATNPTKIIIHGFGSTCSREWALEMRSALLSVEDCNVICVDWENGATIPNYVRAAANTRLVGKQVAHLILWLKERLGSQTDAFHLIGFSLGAHVAGFTGQEVRNISRITGLDPAGPLFESYDQRVRLDSSDANFVDVIHSNGDSLLMGGLGSWEPMGHVDFYPNGGRVQKGCSNLFLGAVRDFLWSASNGDGRSLCNHRRAYKFFTESVSPHCPFPAFSCESYEKFLTGACWDVSRSCNMGYYADRNPKKGLLYLVTREEEPFCANQFRLTIESSPSAAPISTYGGLEAVVISKNLNESFIVTQSLKDNMVAGSVLQRMVVASPAITDPIKIQLKYTAYQGWLYSGISRWSMDRLILMSAFGKSVSFCTRGLLLPSGIPVTVTLTPGICTNGFLPSSRPIYYPYENILAPIVSPESNHLPENSSEVLDYTYHTLDKQESNKTEVKIKICQLSEINSTLECNDWNNTIPKYEAADPDVILPPQLQYILYQLESQGLGPVNKSAKVVTRPTPLSRALKGRVVVLPGRKGRGYEYVPPNGTTLTAAQLDFIQRGGGDPVGLNGQLPLHGQGGSPNLLGHVQIGSTIFHGVNTNSKLVRDAMPQPNGLLKNVHISVPLKELQLQQPKSHAQLQNFQQQQQQHQHNFIQQQINHNNNNMHNVPPPNASHMHKQSGISNAQNMPIQQQQQQSVHTSSSMQNVPMPLLQSQSVQTIPFKVPIQNIALQQQQNNIPSMPLTQPQQQQNSQLSQNVQISPLQPPQVGQVQQNSMQNNIPIQQKQQTELTTVSGPLQQHGGGGVQNIHLQNIQSIPQQQQQSQQSGPVQHQQQTVPMQAPQQQQQQQQMESGGPPLPQQNIMQAQAQIQQVNLQSGQNIPPQLQLQNNNNGPTLQNIQEQNVQNLHLQQNNHAQNIPIQEQNVQNLHLQQNSHAQNIPIQEQNVQNLHLQQNSHAQNIPIQEQNLHLQQSSHAQTIPIQEQQNMQNLHLQQNSHAQNIPIQEQNVQNLHLQQNSHAQNIPIQEQQNVHNLHLQQNSHAQNIPIQQQHQEGPSQQQQQQNLLNIPIQQVQQQQQHNINVQNIHLQGNVGNMGLPPPPPHQQPAPNQAPHPKDLTQRSYTRRPYRNGKGHVTTKGYYIVPFFRPLRRNAKLFYEDRYRN